MHIAERKDRRGRLGVAMAGAVLRSGSVTTPQATLLPSRSRLDVKPISQYGIEEG